MLTLGELKQIKESLKELDPDVEKFSWGPTYEFAIRRKKEALAVLEKEIKGFKNEKS